MAVFRLLVSAELESYFEELADDTLQEMIAKRDTGKFTRAAASLLATQKSISPPSNTDDVKNKSFFVRACGDSDAAHTRIIAANKGASSHNLFSLLLPLGLDETRLEEDFLRNLALLAVRRGDFAHRRIDSVLNLPNPIEDQALVLSIARHLETLENLMREALEVQ